MSSKGGSWFEWWRDCGSCQIAVLADTNDEENGEDSKVKSGDTVTNAEEDGDDDAGSGIDSDDDDMSVGIHVDETDCDTKNENDNTI